VSQTTAYDSEVRLVTITDTISPKPIAVSTFTTENSRVTVVSIVISTGIGSAVTNDYHRSTPALEYYVYITYYGYDVLVGNKVRTVAPTATLV
jgi:hypothetical protein